MNKKLVVIGCGIAGYTFASEIVTLGKKNNLDFDITIIDKKEICGVCLNNGCIPTKSAIYLSEKIKDLNQIKIKNKQIINVLQQGIKQLLKNINYINDEAIISSDKQIYLKNNARYIDFDFLIIATGSYPDVPQIFHNKEDIYTSDTIFDINEIPERLVIVGGGYIGLEFATLFNNLGSKITIIEKESRLLPNLNEEIGNELQKLFLKNGIELIFEENIIKIEQNIVYTENNELLYDKLLIATGRKPLVMEPKINIETNLNGFKINKFFETSQKGIFVIGDATNNLLLAHKAEYDAKTLAKNLISEILGKEKTVPDYSLIPFCIFSSPEVVIVGNTSNLNKFVKVRFTKIGRAYCNDATDGYIKLYLDENNRVVGAEVINKKASDLLGSLILIINNKMTCNQISDIIFAHPTMDEIIKEAAIIGSK